MIRRRAGRLPAGPHRRAVTVGAVALLFCLGLPLVALGAVPAGVAHAQEAPQAVPFTPTPEPPAVAPAVAPAAALASPPSPAVPAGDQPASGSGPALPRWLSDPRGFLADLLSQWFLSLLQGVATFLHAAVDGLLHSSANVISQTPPDLSYANPTVQGLWELARRIANAALVLVVIWGGINLLTREQLGAAYQEVGELLTRVAVGALLVNTSGWWARLAIDVNNALCHAFGDVTLPAWEQVDTTTQALANVLAGLVYLVAAVLLVIQQLMRLALVDVLLVAAPLALACWVVPNTQGWYQRWSSAFFSTVFIQFVQVLALKLGTALVLGLAPQTPDAQIAGALLGIAMLFVTIKLPEFLRDYAGDGLSFARYVAYRRAAQVLQGKGGGGQGAGEKAAGAAATAVQLPLWTERPRWWSFGGRFGGGSR